MPVRGIVLPHIIENRLCVVKDDILIAVFMNMFTGLEAREQLRLEAGLRLFINEQRQDQNQRQMISHNN